MNEKKLNEHLRMIYLKEDFTMIATRLLNKIKGGSFSPDKASKENVPSLYAVDDYAKKNFEDYQHIRKMIDTKGKNFTEDEKIAYTVTMAAAKEMQKEETLRDHAEDILNELQKKLEFGVKAGGETTIFLFILEVLLKYCGRNFIARKLSFYTTKFAAVTVVILMFYILAKLGHIIVRRKKEEI